MPDTHSSSNSSSNAKIYFRHDRLRGHQDKMISDIYGAVSSKKHILIHAPTGLGKCISGDSLVFTSDGLIEARDMVDGEVDVLRIDDQKVTLKKGFKVKIGREKLLKIKTRHGYEIKSTYSHKFLTPNGWSEASKLKIGQKVATTRKLQIKQKRIKPFSFKPSGRYTSHFKKITIRMSEKVAYLVGAFIGDGSFNSNIRVRFTLKSPEIIARIRVAFEDAGLILKQYGQSDFHVDSIVIKKFLEHYGSPDIRIGRKGGKCSNVYVPNEFITGPKKILSSFLRGLYDTDGYIEKSHSINLTTKSFRLAKTLKFCLLRLGIITQLAVKRNLKYGNYYIVRITDKLSIYKFNKSVGFSVAHKSERLKDCIYSLSLKKLNPNIDAFEFDICFLKSLRRLVPWNSKMYNSLCEYIVNNKKPTRFMLEVLHRYLSNNKAPKNIVNRLEMHLYSDVLWDEVIDISKEKENDIYDFCVPDGHNFIAEGFVLHNSDASIAAAITTAIEQDLTVFFLTPKISQHKIAIDVVRGIAKKYQLDIRATDIIGRRYACIDPSLADLDHDGFYLSCEKKRKKESCEFFRCAKGYSRFDQSKANSLFENVLSEYGVAKTHSEMIKLGEKHSACPYEWMIKTASVSNVIIADYYHLMIPRIREIFLMKTKKHLEKSIVICDEAHNLASRVREQMSTTVSYFMLSRIEKEMKAVGAEKLQMASEFSEWADGNLKKSNEMLLTPESFDEFISQYDKDKNALAEYFESIGADFIERINKKSACMKFAWFLRNWDLKEKGSFRILKRRGQNFTLSKRFLDPSPVTSELNKTYSSVLMSGTLLPLEMHRDILGLDEKRTELRSYRSPFDENNTLNVISNSTTTRYSKRDFENYKKMAKQIDGVIDSSPQGVAVFFPSYNVLNSVVPLLSNQNLLAQKENMGPTETGELLRNFSSGKGVLCAVQGGSLAEGVDYCNEEIKTAIIVGIALEEPSLETQSLIDYYQEKFRKGWEYGYMYPAVIKALQAAGRGIRKETDRAAIVFMDERFNWKNYRTILNDGRKFVVTDEPAKYVKFFWSGYKK